MPPIAAPRAASVALAPRVLVTLRAWFEALAHEIRLHRDLRQLEALDDHRLHDIGLDRGALEDAVRHGRMRARRYG